MNDPKQILVRRDGHGARVIINRPQRRNALSFAAWHSLAAAFDNIAADSDVRVVILTGAGDRAFCAGNDISEFAEKRSSPEQIEAYDAVLKDTWEIMQRLDKPLVARVRGFAVGGGFELMQACDLQIAGAGARFAMTPARLGVGYSLDDVQLLVDRIGPRAAREMLFTGRLFDAAEAERMGLVTRVVPDEDLDAAVDACAAEIASNAPLSVRVLFPALSRIGLLVLFLNEHGLICHIASSSSRSWEGAIRLGGHGGVAVIGVLPVVVMRRDWPARRAWQGIQTGPSTSSNRASCLSWQACWGWARGWAAGGAVGW